MSVVVKIIGGVEGIERHPELVEHIGRYVQGYHPERAPLREQWIWTTDDVNEAARYEDFGAWHEIYTQSIGTRPWDGRPDRPITVFHVEVQKEEHGKEDVHAPVHG